MPKEARARIKINKFLEEAGWRFFDSPAGRANIVLEPSIKITKTKLNGLGDNFDKTTTGFIDFLLLDKQGFPFIVLEAKAEAKIRYSEKNKPGNTLNPSIVVLSFCPTETAIIFGIWSVKAPMLFTVFLRRN
jgi:type I restriction enzyme R subunit